MRRLKLRDVAVTIIILVIVFVVSAYSARIGGSFRQTISDTNTRQEIIIAKQDSLLVEVRILQACLNAHARYHIGGTNAVASRARRTRTETTSLNRYGSSYSTP